MTTQSDRRGYLLVTLCYWAFTLSDGALRMLVLMHLHAQGQTAWALALILLPYEVAGVATNLLGGYLNARAGGVLRGHGNSGPPWRVAGLDTGATSEMSLRSVPRQLTELSEAHADLGRADASRSSARQRQLCSCVIYNGSCISPSKTQLPAPCGHNPCDIIAARGIWVIDVYGSFPASICNNGSLDSNMPQCSMDDSHAVCDNGSTDSDTRLLLLLL